MSRIESSLIRRETTLWASILGTLYQITGLILSVHSKPPWHSVRFATNKSDTGLWVNLHCFNVMQILPYIVNM